MRGVAGWARRGVAGEGPVGPALVMRKIGGLSTEAKSTAESDPLAPFSAPVRRWFEASFEGPTPAQAGGWEAISSGAHTLICAPTGSGKTLASFLWGIDRLSRATEQPPGVRLVYVSPLKALSYDIERNLRAPLKGIGADISVGLRTGDTPQSERRAMNKTPPEILITTPESLYLMLSSSVREIFATAEAVIVDEIHAVAQSKRGSHLALTLERLEHLVGESGEARRSNSGEAPPSPPADIARSSGSGSRRRSGRWSGSRNSSSGPKRECEIVDAGRTKELDLQIVVPVEDMAEPGAPNFPNADGRARRGRAARPRPLDLARDLPRAPRAGPGTHLDDHLRQRPARRRAPGEAPQRAGQREGGTELPATEHGGHSGEALPSNSGEARRARSRRATRSRSPGPTTGPSPTRSGLVVEEMLKSRAAAVPRRDLLPGAGDRHGRGRPGDPGRVAEVGQPRPAAGRPRRPLARRGLAGPDLPQVPRRPARVRGRRQAHAGGGDRGDGDPPEPARRARPAPGLDGGPRRVGGRRGRAPGHRLRALPRPLPRAARERPRHARRALPLRPLRRAAPADRLGPHRGHDARPQRRPPAGRHQRRHDPRPRPLRRPPARRPPGRRARRGDGLRGARRARPSCSARRPGGSRRSPATG